ncbi:hypothetical protein [Pseudomonas sp. CGJS7]|uniref:hypothetical protein n=1 Tax=Pseudomonas sp. CGJS7 TaxID=3109348 RepID=UPI00300AF0C7
MPASTHQAHLLRQHPELGELSRYYASLGLESPIQWALSERAGEPAVATAALVHALLAEVAPARDEAWLSAIRAGEVNVGNEALIAEAGAALRTVEQAGVDPRALTPLVRAIQAQVVRNIAALLDQGPEISCIPLPPGREAHWQLYSVQADDSPGREIVGLYPLIDGSGAI